jgi:hypothetical protein
MSIRIYRIATDYQTLILSAGVVLIGFILLFLSKYPVWPPTMDMFLSIVGELGGILIAAGVVAFLWEKSAKRSFFEEIMEKIKLAEQVRDLGLVTITTKAYREVDWPELFRNVRELDMCFAYARTWRHMNTLYLQDLASRSDVRIRLIIPDPENVEIIKELSRRFEMTPDELKSQINEAKAEFDEIFNDNCKAKYSLWYLLTTPVFSFYRFDNTAIITLQRYGKYKGGLPSFEVKKGGELYQFIENELDFILDEKNGMAKPITKLQSLR